ncbi:nitrous-oxide reductase [Neisseria gonorrhoeae]|nr:nitrous-oxide reductase [Neisseria gonorrhoeae]
MEIAWQVLVDGNLDNGDADYQGKYFFATCYNSERALTVQGASSNEQDWCVVFDLKASKKASKRATSKKLTV